MWKLAIEDDQGTKTVVNLVRDEYSIGRGEENTIRLTERNVSRRHARLNKVADGWQFSDVESYNGAYVNGVRVGAGQPLGHDDLIQIGDYRLVMTDDTLVASSARAATVPAGPKAHLLTRQPDRLVMVVGPTPGAEYPLGAERVLIGRGEECQISINHGSVSRVHAEIEPLGGGRYEVVDRGSSNGLRVNGADMERALLDARDAIELGDVLLRFIPAGMVYLPGADESQQISAVDPLSSQLDDAPPPAQVPIALRAAAALLALSLLLALGMWIFGQHGTVAPAPSSGASSDSAAALLNQAKTMAASGDLASAMELLAKIPKESNLRQAGDFRDLAARWADATLDQAAAATDDDAKRKLYDSVAKQEAVDGVRRKRASDALAALPTGDGVSVTDLPSGTLDAPKKAGDTPAPVTGGLVRRNPFDEPGATTPAAKPPAPGAAPAATEASGSDLGDRTKLLAQKNALKAKVAAGSATDLDRRMLRALCRQLGDSSCVN